MSLDFLPFLLQLRKDNLIAFQPVCVAEQVCVSRQCAVCFIVFRGKLSKPFHLPILETRRHIWDFSDKHFNIKNNGILSHKDTQPSKPHLADILLPSRKYRRMASMECHFEDDIIQHRKLLSKCHRYSMNL